MCFSHLIYTVPPCLIHTCHPIPCHAPTMPFFSRPQHSTAVERRPCCAVVLRRTAWSEHGMASVNQTRPNCVNQMGKTHSKPLAARHGRGTAWAWHGHGMLCVNRPLVTHLVISSQSPYQSSTLVFQLLPKTKMQPQSTTFYVTYSQTLHALGNSSRQPK
jgi:hypothetical protein